MSDISSRSIQANRTLESWVFATIFIVLVVIGLVIPNSWTVAIAVGIAGITALLFLFRFVIEPIYTDFVLDHEINRPLTPEEQVQVDEHLMESGLPPRYGVRPDETTDERWLGSGA